MVIGILRGRKTTKYHLQRKHMSSSFKVSHPVVKRNNKIFDLIWFDFISFEVLKTRCFDANKLLYFDSNKIHPTSKPTQI